SGTAFLSSTYLGGSDADYAFGVALGAEGDAFVTGGAASPDFPTTPGAFNTTPNGSVDMFVTRMNSSDTGIVSSTLLGGVGVEDGWDLALDAAGAVYVTGRSSSPTFPVTPGSYSTVYQGSFDTVVLKMSHDLSTLIYSTFVSAPRRDEGARDR